MPAMISTVRCAWRATRLSLPCPSVTVRGFPSIARPFSSQVTHTDGLNEVKDSVLLSHVNPSEGPLSNFERLVQEGVLRDDRAQHGSVVAMDRLFWDMKRKLEDHDSSKSIFGSIFGSSDDDFSFDGVRGLYIYGGVGSGKTFVMDLFFLCAPLPATQKRRVHFHKFMYEIHQRLHQLRKRNERANLVRVAEDLVHEDGHLICFDEFNVIDVADALILRSLFNKLWERGVLVVATSNRHPAELYKNGLQRHLFLPCIDDIMERCEVHHMESEVDHRLLTHATSGSASTYIMIDESNPRDAAEQQMLAQMYELVDGSLRFSDASEGLRAGYVRTKGRKIAVPKACKGVAFFTFADLCSQPLGAADYLIIARAFHTVFIHDVPLLGLSKLPEVRRMISMIDVFYDCKVKIVVSAAAEPFDLFVDKDETNAQDEVFSFDRCASRLRDMQSQEYKSVRHNPPLPDAEETKKVLGDDASLLHELHMSELSDEDIDHIWSHYDVNKNNSLTRDELELLFVDISMLRSGHGNVPESVVDEIFAQMDENGDQEISKEEFKKFFASSGLSLWYL